MEKLLLLILKKAELTNIFVHVFFFVYLFSGNMVFFAYLVCIYFRKCSVKENFLCTVFPLVSAGPQISAAL